MREYGSLATLVEQVDKVSGKVGDALREHLGSVIRNRQLTELVRDAPVDVEIPALERVTWDRDQVHALFDNLQFRVLRERLFATLAAEEPEAEEGFDVDGAASGRRRGRVVVGRARARPQPAGRASRSAGRGGAASERLTGVALATADGAGAYLQPDQLCGRR